MSARMSVRWLAVAAVMVFAIGASAQEKKAPDMTPEQAAMMQAYQKAGTPGPQHKMLASTAGTYDLKIKSWHEPGGAPMEDTGTATRKMILDGRVLVEDMSSKMMGMPFAGHGMHGFDNVTGKYWVLWMDSMSTGVMVSEGTCDEKGACTYTGSWNDAMTKAPVKARMKVTPTGPGSVLFEMWGPDPKGTEFKMMEMTYTKKP